MRNLRLSLFFTLTLTSVWCQKNTRFTRANKNAPVYTFAEGTMYSRSIVVKDSFVFLGCSNGSLYKYNLLREESSNLLAGKRFEEIRDIHVTDSSVIAMQSGSNGLLALTTYDHFIKYIFPPRGQWNHVFLDGMSIKDSIGFVMGDPVDGYFSLFQSQDGGMHWDACAGKLLARPDEAGFAASGTTVHVLNDSTFAFVSGGMDTRFFKSTDLGHTWQAWDIPYLKDKSSGAFSMCFKNAMEGVVVGGDFSNPTLNANNSYYTKDGGIFWMISEKPVLGYRSCVIEKNGVYYACGTTGIDVSFDDGQTWTAFQYGNYFALTTDDLFLYATMPNGQFQQLQLVTK